MKLDTAVLQALAPADDLSPETAAEAWLFACDARWMAGRAARDAQHEPVAIADHRAPVLRIIGLPDHRPLRAAVPRARGARLKRIAPERRA